MNVGDRITTTGTWGKAGKKSGVIREVARVEHVGWQYRVTFDDEPGLGWWLASDEIEAKAPEHYGAWS